MAFGLGALASFAVASGALAQDLSPAERQAAAEAAYDRGTQAYVGGDYAAAARWYERAHELAPAANAMIQAIRASVRANNHLRAATLGVELRRLYGEERMTQHSPQVEEVAPRALRVEVACEGCELEIDGERERYRTFFLAPDTEHVIVGHFESGDRTERLMGRPGETRAIELTAPEVAATETPTEVPVETPIETPVRPTRPIDDDGGISPAFAIIAIGLTAVAGGVTLWSGLDTLDKNEAYEASPTLEGLEEGRDLELRTNVLIGTTVGLGVLSLVALILTDWDGSPEEAPPPEVSLVPIEGGLALGAGGRFH